MKNFSNVPSVRYNRSKFDLSHGVKTTMSIGKLYPLKVQEVLPGDTFKSYMTGVVRCTSAFLKPIIDNLFMDVHHFFVPYRLVFERTERVFGNPNPSAYEDNVLEEFPYLTSPFICYPGTVGDYLGLPVDNGDGSGRRFVSSGVSLLPFRAFAKVYNDWFRNENTVDEIYIQKGGYKSSEYPNNNPWAPNNYTGQLPYVSKKKDYFTAGLPNVQKGASVPLPLGDIAPVRFGADNSISTGYVNIKLSEPSSVNLDGKLLFAKTDSNGSHIISVNDDNIASNYSSNSPITISNAFADLSLATASDVSTLRTAFQLQKMLEKDARYGSRYNEFLLGHFGVSSPDSRLQYSEYLGGGRIPIGIQQVSQTSQGTEVSPLGALGANSQSLGHSTYSKGFVEHGFVVTVGCIKQLHTYQQGIPRYFFRRKREDFYDPLLANISEQPVYKKQLFGYVPNSSDKSDLTSEVFNYNEAWADYRYEPSIITGQLRSGITNSLDIWHLGDFYASSPTFGQSFTDETSQNLDRVLAVETLTQDNFLVDLWFNVSAIRVMPVYSVPGLIDHH